MLTEQKGKLSYSVYIAKLLGVKYEGWTIYNRG
jgi:hypothetical protein